MSLFNIIRLPFTFLPQCVISFVQVSLKCISSPANCVLKKYLGVSRYDSALNFVTTLFCVFFLTNVSRNRWLPQNKSLLMQKTGWRSGKSYAYVVILMN